MWRLEKRNTLVLKKVVENMYRAKIQQPFEGKHNERLHFYLCYVAIGKYRELFSIETFSHMFYSSMVLLKMCISF